MKTLKLIVFKSRNISAFLDAMVRRATHTALWLGSESNTCLVQIQGEFSK